VHSQATRSKRPQHRTRAPPVPKADILSPVPYAQVSDAKTSLSLMIRSPSQDVTLFTAYRLRCDRARPACGSCVHRGEITSCAYDNPPGGENVCERKDTAIGPDMIAEDRIEKLERLVQTLIERRSQQSDSGVASLDVPDDEGFEMPVDPLLQTEEPGPGEDSVGGSTVRPSRSLFSTHTDHAHTRPADDGRWTRLLSEVRDV
jgi:hypothetical protein